MAMIFLDAGFMAIKIIIRERKEKEKRDVHRQDIEYRYALNEVGNRHGEQESILKRMRRLMVLRRTCRPDPAFAEKFKGKVQEN